MTSAAQSDEPSDARARVLSAVAGLLDAGGPEAATTRAVAAAAGVQAPTLYRLFGDKRGLLNAAAEHAFARYVADKAGAAPHPDPVQDLRDGWDVHVAFGVANPALFAVMGDPASSAHAAGLAVLRQRVARVARAGQLRVGEARAVALLHAMGTGVIRALIAAPDAGLSEAAREAVLRAILDEAVAAAGPATAATTVRASLDELAMLSPGERHLLGELLDRIANG